MRFKGHQNEISEELWNLIPAAGSYIKNIMKYSGFDTKSAIVKLKQTQELDGMFEFARSMVDVIEDKTAMFGIFHKNPEKVRVLPGLNLSAFSTVNYCVIESYLHATQSVMHLISFPLLFVI